MAGECPGKTRIEDVDVFIHEPNENDGTTRVHIDIEGEAIAEIIGDEATFFGSKGSGGFIGLKEEQAERAESVAQRLREQRSDDQS